jgi:hydroxymethylbilane synthase
VAQELRLGTRGSQLALWQANTVAARIAAAGGPSCRIIVIKTSGDRLQDAPISQVGGKRLFVKEIESLPVIRWLGRQLVNAATSVSAITSATLSRSASSTESPTGTTRRISTTFRSMPRGRSAQGVSFVQKVEREAATRPINRDQLPLAG